MINLNFIYSEIFLCLSIMTLLIIGVFKKNSSNLIYSLSIGTLIFTLALIYSYPIGSEINFFNESYQIDYLSNLMKILTMISGIFVLIISLPLRI